MTRIPIGYFFLDSPPTEDLQLLEFRTVDSHHLQNPSRDLIDTVRQMENIQEWMREYIIASQGERIPFIGMLKNNDDTVHMASAIRQLLSLPINWFESLKNIDDSFKHIRKAVSNIGVIVMMSGIVGTNTHRALNIDEFRAFTLIDDYAPLIFINSTDSRSGMLFSLLHEFIHITIGTNNFYNADINDSNYINPHEIMCNAVTAEILVPKSLFKNKWQNASGELEKKTQTLASYFKCSQTVIFRRALDNGYITNNEYNLFITQTKQITKEKRTTSGGDFYKTQATRIDKKFLLALNASLHEGKTLHSEAFRMTNTNRTTFEELINEV